MNKDQKVWKDYRDYKDQKDQKVLKVQKEDLNQFTWLTHHLDLLLSVPKKKLRSIDQLLWDFLKFKQHKLIQHVKKMNNQLQICYLIDKPMEILNIRLKKKETRMEVKEITKMMMMIICSTELAFVSYF